MGNTFSNDEQKQERAYVTTAAAAEERLRVRQRLHEAEQERQRQRQHLEAERERQCQELERERERERLLQHAKAQAALRLYPRRPLSTSSFYDKYNSYDYDEDWGWSIDRSQAYNDMDDNDDAQNDQGYTGSDGYYRIPHHLHRPQTQSGNKRECLGQKKTDQAYTPPSGKGRRKRGRKGKGDLYENDYHAGHTKSEILAMSSERKAAFEAQKLRRQHQHESFVSA